MILVKSPARIITELRWEYYMKANKYQMCSWVVTLVLALSGTALPLLMDEVIDTTGMETLRSLKQHKTRF